MARRVSIQVIPEPREPIDWEEAARLYRNGLSYAEIARRMGRHAQSIRTGLLAHGVRPRKRTPISKKRHGERLYRIWKGMRYRCSNPKHASYRHYGAKGIRVGREWDKKFEPFYSWALQSGYRAGNSLALRDRAKTFSPRNCFWVSSEEKVKRRLKLAPPPPRRLVTAFGETKGVAAWVRDARCKVGLMTLCRRLDRGLSPKDAISLPGKETQHSPGRPRRKARDKATKKPRSPGIPWEKAIRLYEEQGLSCPQIAERLGVSASGVWTGLKRLGVYKPREPALSSSKLGKPLFAIWRGMRGRCSNPGHAAYAYYGGKGARVCKAWVSFEAFYRWALDAGYRVGLCLSRRTRKRNYSPSNCTWVTRAEAAMRADHPPREAKPRWTLRAFGEEKGPTAWSRDPRCTVGLGSLLKRLRSGMDPEEAITLPPQRSGGIAWQFLVTAFGETKGLTAWSRDRRCRVRLGTLRYRLIHGVEPEVAITTPPFRLHTES